MRILIIILLTLIPFFGKSQDFKYFIAYPNNMVQEQLKFNGCAHLRDDTEVCGEIIYFNMNEAITIKNDKNIKIYNYRYVDYIKRLDNEKYDFNYYIINNSSGSNKAMRLIVGGEVSLFRIEEYSIYYDRSKTAYHQIIYRYYYTNGLNKNFIRIDKFKNDLYLLLVNKNPKIKEYIDHNNINIKNISDVEMIGVMRFFNQILDDKVSVIEK